MTRQVIFANAATEIARVLRTLPNLELSDGWYFDDADPDGIRLWNEDGSSPGFFHHSEWWTFVADNQRREHTP